MPIRGSFGRSQQEPPRPLLFMEVRTGARWAGGKYIHYHFGFLLSFKYGTKNITRSDMFVLILALSAIVVWWLTNNLLLSVLMVTAIDGMGYIPTLRKSWEEPWSETLAFWFAMAIVNVLTILSLGEINWLTAPYLVVLAILNVFVLTICIFRRRFVKSIVVIILTIRLLFPSQYLLAACMCGAKLKLVERSVIIERSGVQSP